MGKRTKFLADHQITFIQEQKLFFVGTAAPDGTVNISPKGLDSLRVTSKNEIVWLNLTGSGNETAAHLQKSNRMTLMFCAFEGKPMIIRTYGQAKIYHTQDSEYKNHIHLFPETLGSRQIIILKIDLVQTSCGFAVPFMDFREERTILEDWARKKGEEGVVAYQQERNSTSLDGYKIKS